MPTQDELKNMSPEQIAELQKQNCPFCLINSGRIPAEKVLDDNLSIAVMDIRPAAKGHVIIYPKEHRMIMPQMADEEIKSVALMAKRLSNAILSAMKVKGTAIFCANGQAAGQKAPHFLLHVIPRSEKDNLFQLKKQTMSDEDLKKLAGALK